MIVTRSWPTKRALLNRSILSVVSAEPSGRAQIPGLQPALRVSDMRGRTSPADPRDMTIGGRRTAREIVVERRSAWRLANQPAAWPLSRRQGQIRPSKRAAAQVVATSLSVAMTGRASPAKAKDGDEPVFVYIRCLPQP